MIDPNRRHPGGLIDASQRTNAGLVLHLTSLRDASGNPDMTRCEDAAPVATYLSGGRVLLGVADGLGGYVQGFDRLTGGRIASDLAMTIVLDYFKHLGPGLHPDPELLTNRIYKSLRHLQETRMQASQVRGSLGRHRLATTLAVVVVDSRAVPETSTIQGYWIGDSRIYVFDQAGLHQLSRDDNLSGADAFDSLFEAAPMFQFLAATMEREWRMHWLGRTLEMPAVVFACTDGCFSEFPSPWAFEALLQNALERANSWEDWITQVRALLEPALADDASLAAMPINLWSFEEFKQLRSGSETVLARCLATTQESSDKAREIWLSLYKPMYESAPGVEICADGAMLNATHPARPQALGSDQPPSSPPKVLSKSVSRRCLKCCCEPLALIRRAVGPENLKPWLIGFLCGLSSGAILMAWLEYFWEGLNS